MGVESKSRFPQFPRGWLVTNEELTVIPLLQDLRPIVNELHTLVFEYWNEKKEDVGLAAAAGNLSICGSLLQREVWLVGRLVLQPMKAYWARRPLLSESDIERLQLLGSVRLAELIERAMSIDLSIRKRLGAPMRFESVDLVLRQ